MRADHAPRPPHAIRAPPARSRRTDRGRRTRTPATRPRTAPPATATAPPTKTSARARQRMFRAPARSEHSSSGKPNATERRDQRRRPAASTRRPARGETAAALHCAMRLQAQRDHAEQQHAQQEHDAIAQLRPEMRDRERGTRPANDGARNVEYSVGSSSTRTASPEYGRQRRMPARNRRNAASSTSAVMSGRASGSRLPGASRVARGSCAA